MERKGKDTTEPLRKSYSSIRNESNCSHSDSNRFNSTGRKSVDNNPNYNSGLANSRDYSSLRNESGKGQKNLNNKKLAESKAKSSSNLAVSIILQEKTENEQQSKEAPNSEVMSRYAHLLKSYEKLTQTSNELKESLKLEVLRNEEQRAYIEALKQSIRFDFEKSGLLPIFKTIQDKMRLQFHLRKGEDSQREGRIDNELDNLLGPNYVEFFMKLVSGEKKSEENSIKKGLLQNELRNANDKLLNVLNQNKILQNELNESEKKAEGANKEVEQVKKALDIIHKENMHLNEEKKSLINYIAEVEENPNKQGEKMREEMEKLHEEVAAQKLHSRDLEVNTKELEHQKMLLNRLVTEKLGIIADFEKEKQEMSRIIKNQEELLNVNTSENIRLTLEQEAVIKRLQGDIEALRRDNEALRADNEDLIQVLAKTRGELKDAKEFPSENNSARRLEERKASIEAKAITNLNVEQLKAENLSLVQDIMRLTEDTNRMAGSFKQAQREVYDIKKKIIGKDELIKTMTEKIAQLEREEEGEKPKIINLQKVKIISSSVACQTIEEQPPKEVIIYQNDEAVEKHQTFLKILQADLEDLLNSCLAHQIKQEVSSHDGTVTEIDTDSIQKQLRELKSRIVNLSSEYKQLAQNIEEKDLQLDDVQKQLKRQVANTEKVNKDLRLLKHESKAMTEERDYLMNATIELDKQ